MPDCVAIRSRPANSCFWDDRTCSSVLRDRHSRRIQSLSAARVCSPRGRSSAAGHAAAPFPLRKLLCGGSMTTRTVPRSRVRRRASGHQHRKKAKARGTTHISVLAVLDFATAGLWPVGRSDWLRVDEPSQPEMGIFSPTLAALQDDVLTCLARILDWRRSGSAAGSLVPDDAFKRSVAAAVQEGKQKGPLDDVVQQGLNAIRVSDRALRHLDEGERWRHVYQCTTCGSWFFARKHDPRDPNEPYCGKKCWPSKQTIRDVVAPPRRVQSRRK
jgi:hypothetical protein